MKRQYVYMSGFREDAEMVGKRKANSPAILEILADNANESGVKYYKGNERVWLAEAIPVKFIAVVKTGS